MKEGTTTPILPCAAELLVPQRSPMLVIARLIERDIQANFSVVEATVPDSGIFLEKNGRLLPEYFIELLAQAMASVNGYDGLLEGEKHGRGFLVGIDNFHWYGTAEPGEELSVEIEKDYDFGPVSVMSGKVFNSKEEIIASGEIKAWEEK